MTQTPPKPKDANAVRAEGMRLAVAFTIEGDLRYLAHHDVMRMLTRALIRARLPLAYTQGFNPQARISLPFPRPLGVASDAELAIVDLVERVDPTNVAASLAAVTPSECNIMRVGEFASKAAPHALEVTYETEIAPSLADAIRARVAELTSAETLVIQRDNGPKKPSRSFDIRPFIHSVSAEGRTLRMRLGVTQTGTARPIEVLNALGLPAEEYLHQTRRVRVEWDMDWAAADAAPPVGKD